MTLRVFEAFAGIGTQRIALKRAGISHDVVGISENNRQAVNSYRAIHGDTVNFGDIRSIAAGSVPDHDLFTYSFPCQDISIAGNRKGFAQGSGTSSSLVWDCQEIIKRKRPKYLLLENVKAITNANNRPGFDKWLTTLEGYGYTSYWHVLNAKDYGVPQNRERVFCVSIHGDHEAFNFPERKPLNVSARDILEDSVSREYFISAAVARRFTYSPRLDTDIKIYGNVKKRANSIGYRYLVYEPTGILPCLTATEAKLPKLVHVSQGIRKITPREAWRLMGIQDEDYDKAARVNSHSQLYRQAGNAIAVPVLTEIFTNLLKGKQ